VSDGGELLLPAFILPESTVKVTFNTPCELLGGGGNQERKARVLYEIWGLIPLRGVENSLSDSKKSTGASFNDVTVDYSFLNVEKP